MNVTEHTPRGRQVQWNPVEGVDDYEVHLLVPNWAYDPDHDPPEAMFYEKTNTSIPSSRTYLDLGWQQTVPDPHLDACIYPNEDYCFIAVAKVRAVRKCPGGQIQNGDWSDQIWFLMKW